MTENSPTEETFFVYITRENKTGIFAKKWNGDKAHNLREIFRVAGNNPFDYPRVGEQSKLLIYRAKFARHRFYNFRVIEIIDLSHEISIHKGEYP